MVRVSLSYSSISTADISKLLDFSKTFDGPESFCYCLLLKYYRFIHVMSLKEASGRFFIHFGEDFEKCIGKFLLHFREILNCHEKVVSFRRILDNFTAHFLESP